MLPRQNRLTENRDFLRIFKTIRPYHTEHTAIRCVRRNPNQIQGKDLSTRIGFVVSNKIDKRSARRNGMKRRIRAVVEKNLPEISNGIDVVIQVKKPFDFPYNFSAIEKEVLEGLEKSGVMR